METINVILGNTKIIMENMSHTLEEIKNYVNELMEELIEKAVMVCLEEGLCQNQISLREGNQKNPYVTKSDLEGEGQSTPMFG
jgi:hypothetical protein